MIKLDGKNAVITGANRGIGNCLVRIFAENGCNVWACARTPSEEFEENLRLIAEKSGVSVTPIYFDLSDEDSVKTGMKKILSEKKSVDILINNAGVPHGGLMTMTPVSKVREVYEVNVFAQIQIMQLAAKAMMKQKSGCIINMCSVGGIETNPGYLAYGSSKAALIWITKSVAKELALYGIRVNGIAPGLVDTNMGYYKSENEMKKVLDRMSIKRMGKPEEIAAAALYLASDDAAYMTGQIMILDGGRV